MDLSYGEEYEALRHEVRAFLDENKKRAPQRTIGARGGARDKAIEWQRLLIERGYTARTIPKEYGGYGAEPDVLIDVILDEEFSLAGVARGLSGQGPSMLVPTLLEHGS